MKNIYCRFFSVWLLLAGHFISCQQMHTSFYNDLNIRDQAFKEQILSLARESMVEGFVKLGSDLEKKFQDLGIDLRHRVAELSGEIYNLKENLIRQGFKLEKQSASFTYPSEESPPLSSKLDSLEEKIKRSVEESKGETKLLKRKLDILENENKILSTRLDATQMIIMEMAPLSSNRTRNSFDFFPEDVLQKIDYVDNKLHNLNETFSNASVKMFEEIGAFQAEVSTLKQSVKIVNVSVNSALEKSNKTAEGLAGLKKYVMLNVTEKINDTRGHFLKEIHTTLTDVDEVRNSSKLLTKSIFDLKQRDGELEVHVRRLSQKGQIIITKLIALENDYNITMSDFVNFKLKQQNISFEMAVIMFQISGIKDSLNETKEYMLNLENKVFENLTDFKAEVQLFCKIAHDNLQSNLSEATEFSNRIRTELRNLSSDHSIRILEIQGLKQNISILQSDTELLKYNQNQTKSDISEMMMHRKETNASISSLLTMIVSINQSVNECLKKADTFKSAVSDSNLNLKRLENRFTVIQSNMSHLQTSIDKNKHTNENQTFYITRILQDNSNVDNSITDLTRNLSVVKQREESMNIKMRNFSLEWSAFLVENNIEVTAMKQKINSTAESFEDLKFLIEATNVSCETNIKDLKISLRKITMDLSAVDASLSNLQQDLNSSRILQDRSKVEIYNITSKIQELQAQINNSGMVSKIQDEVASFSEDIRNQETSMTRISTEVTSIRASIALLQNNLNLTIDVNNAQREALSRINNQLISLVPVRLVGGSSQNEGRVEVWYSGTWGTVCDDSWGNMDARVVCRMLGYSGYTAYGSAHFGQGSGTIWLDDVACSGTERSILSCSHLGMGTHNCQHSEDASVRCT